MTNRHLLIVGLLAIVAAVFVGLSFGGSPDRKTEQIAANKEQPAPRTEETRPALRDELQKRCEKLAAKLAADDAEEADIKDACACAVDEIHSEFEDELPDIIKSGHADPKSEERIDAIIDECVQDSGLELQ